MPKKIYDVCPVASCGFLSASKNPGPNRCSTGGAALSANHLGVVRLSHVRDLRPIPAMASPAGSPKGVGGGYVGLAGEFMGFPLIITDPKVLWDFSRDVGKIWKGKTNRQSPAQPKPSGSAGGGEKQ